MTRSIIFCASLWMFSGSIGLSSETVTSFGEAEKQVTGNPLTNEKSEDLESKSKNLSGVTQSPSVKETEYELNRLMSENDLASRLYGNPYSAPQTSFGRFSSFFTPAPDEETITRNFFKNIGFSPTTNKEDGT